MPRQAKSRNFAFTYHLQDGGTEEENILSVQCDYLIYQYELGAEGRVHIQGFMSFKNEVTFKKIHNVCPMIWVQKAKASAAKNIQYCSKSDTRIAGPYEWGDRPCQGYRSDLIVQCNMIKEGKAPLDVVADIPQACRNIKYLQTYAAAITNRSPGFVPKVFIRYGPSGSGKTRWVFDTYGHAGVFKLAYNKGTAWWDGYSNQKCILLDDWPLIEDSNVYNWLLEWCDRYPTSVQFKGGVTRLGESDIVITSNDPPITWFGGRGLRALERRVTSIEHVAYDCASSTGSNISQ